MVQPVKFRASSIADLMTEPKVKTEVLSVGAKTHVRKLVAQAVMGIDFEVLGKTLDKGNFVELDSMEMFNRVFGLQLVKNEEQRSDDYFTGTCDLVDLQRIVDIKSSWSAATFPIALVDAINKTYEYQLRTYMRLWDKPRGTVAYCLVNTPDALIRYEPIQMHVVSHIPEHMRITTWSIERDLDIEARMIEKVKHARAYYDEVLREFDRTHRIDVFAAESEQLPPIESSPIPETLFD